MTHRGFIRGNRFKSHSVHDFDLCESCQKNSARFPESAYGPFTTIAPPAADQQRGQKRCWGWQNRRGPAAEQQSWRQGPGQQEQKPVPEAEKWDLMDTLKAAIEKGSQIFEEVGQHSEISDIARAIAESLKEATPAKEAQETRKQEEFKPVPAAAPVVPEQAKPEVKKEEESKPEEDPFIKWAPQLRQLELLGFDKLETYIEFLEEEHGDLERVVNRIVRRDM